MITNVFADQQSNCSLKNQAYSDMFFPCTISISTCFISDQSMLSQQAAPQYWRNLDPSWRGDRAPMRRYFHSNGTLTADANDPCWGGHEANYAVIDITGPGENFTKRFVRVNHWPMMQVHRKENWGWSLVSDFTVFDSLPDYEKGGTGPL